MASGWLPFASAKSPAVDHFVSYKWTDSPTAKSYKAIGYFFGHKYEASCAISALVVALNVIPLGFVVGVNAYWWTIPCVVLSIGGLGCVHLWACVYFPSLARWSAPWKSERLTFWLDKVRRIVTLSAYSGLF